jgi:hypothetical protein
MRSVKSFLFIGHPAIELVAGLDSDDLRRLTAGIRRG